MNAIEVDGVTKLYWKVQERSLIRSIRPFANRNRVRLSALHDVSLCVERGETVGMIGRNGAGKSTLMRLLAGVSQPSAGTVVTRGRTVPLLSVGVGFHREMTGRENIYVNAMLLGLSKPEIRERFDDIVEFAELGDFIDTPVKFYSSGMFMRLGFSVAIHVDPDILLVDEVLAVGDVGFQLRCFDRMRELQASGTSIVFVSHSMHAIHILCPRVLVLHQGELVFDGATEVGIARYHQVLAEPDDATHSGALYVVRRDLLSDGMPVDSIEQGQPLLYRATLRFEKPVTAPQITFRVLAEDGTLAYGAATKFGDRWRTYEPGEEATVEIAFEARFGGGGTFRIVMYVVDDDGSVVLAGDPDPPSFYVPPHRGVTGLADLGAKITIDGVPRNDHASRRFVRRALGDGREHTRISE